MARSHGVPVSTMRGNKWGWTDADRALALALQVHEDSVCRGCGQYADESHDERSEGYYETRAVVCQACAEQDRQRQRAQDEGGARDKPGEKRWITDVRRHPDD